MRASVVPFNALRRFFYCLWSIEMWVVSLQLGSVGIKQDTSSSVYLHHSTFEGVVMYPNSFVLSQVTWPYGAAEVIVQNYNSVLTLSHLCQLSDAILVHENDTVHIIYIKHISISGQ